ncbi:o-succinylbenzoate--CoA ligase [Mycolicibacterium sp. GF69]|uniref:o-succinylbenzoate--CoA ligase n=1 Tax=Mycolicibacterium sp. GF69 TaxID=2267251 RepID=UPI000DCD429B|nr:o-succinylbenzoate--CoA ligase [Mycolicibacterium sp. GF69]RAV10691.1 o-succinylbenzoate--CoA ligase [Mycolicibacterium sp. GF69]
MAVLSAVPVGAGAAAVSVLPVVHDMLAGHAHVLLVPADDDRESPLLRTSLRVGTEIDDDVAVVVSTSGTTGTPKGALLTAAALTASAEATHHRLGGPGQWLLALSAHHVAGLQVLVRSVVAGTTPVAISPSFEVTELVSAIGALGSGRRYAALVAVQLAKALRHDRAAAALATLDAVLIGGGPMPAGLAERAAAAEISVVRTYGMSETAGGCVYDGVPLDGVRVRIAEQSAYGRIVLGGATLAKGYRNPADPDPFADAGWFRTDDVGAVDSSGRLTVLGRLDDAISSGGLTIMPQNVEAALATHAAIAECAVFGVPDERLGQRVAAAVVLAAGCDAPSSAELCEHVAASLDITAAPRQVHVVGELPRRGIGKIDRRALAARFS